MNTLKPYKYRIAVLQVSLEHHFHAAAEDFIPHFLPQTVGGSSDLGNIFCAIQITFKV